MFWIEILHMTKSQVLNFLALGATTLFLAGCSVGNLLGGGGKTSPEAVQVPVGNQLALPPDLQLAAPTETTDAYQSNGVVADENAASATAVAPAAPAAPVQDIYAKYNISKAKPDGTAKTREELQAELKKAMLAEKRRNNPNYGTIRNIGAIFTDG
jgi:hypothetical protein